MNAEFTRPEPIEALPEVPIWKQSWVIDLAKQILGAAFVLFLIFGVLKPTLKNLVAKEINLNQAVLSGSPVAALPGGSAAISSETENIPAQIGRTEDTPMLSSPVTYQSSLDSVKSMVKEEPVLTAQVVKGWVGEDS